MLIFTPTVVLTVIIIHSMKPGWPSPGVAAVLLLFATVIDLFNIIGVDLRTKK